MANDQRTVASDTYGYNSAAGVEEVQMNPAYNTSARCGKMTPECYPGQPPMYVPVYVPVNQQPAGYNSMPSSGQQQVGGTNYQRQQQLLELQHQQQQQGGLQQVDEYDDGYSQQRQWGQQALLQPQQQGDGDVLLATHLFSNSRVGRRFSPRDDWDDSRGCGRRRRRKKQGILHMLVGHVLDSSSSKQGFQPASGRY